MRLIAAISSVLFLSAAAHAAPPAAPPAQIDILVQKDKSTRLSGADYDDKAQSFQFNVEIRNKELSKSFEKLKATLIVTGKHTTKPIYTILDRQESRFDLASKGLHEFKGNSVTLDFDDNKYMKYGTKYDGYVLVIEDEKGQVLATKASGTSLIRNYFKIRDLPVKSQYTDKYVPIPAAPSPGP